MLIASAYDKSRTGRSRIEFFLKRPRWSLNEAALLIANIDPDFTRFNTNKTGFLTAITLTGLKYPSQPEEEDSRTTSTTILHEAISDELEEQYPEAEDAAENLLEELFLDYLECCRILKELGNERQSATPQEWVELARSANLRIPWEDWALRQKLLQGSNENGAPETFTAQNVRASKWSHNDYLWTISVLLTLLREQPNIHEKHGRKLLPQNLVIDAILKDFPRESFLSKSNLQKYFARANRLIKGNKPQDTKVASKSHTNYLIMIGALKYELIKERRKNSIEGDLAIASSDEALINAIQSRFSSSSFSLPARIDTLFAEATRVINTLGSE